MDFVQELGEIDTYPGTSLPQKYIGILRGSAKEVYPRYDLAQEDLFTGEDIIVA